MNRDYKIFIVGGGSRLNTCLPVLIKSKLKLSGVIITKKDKIVSIKSSLKKYNIKTFKEWDSFVKSVNSFKKAVVFFISHNKIINPKIFLTAHLVNYHASPLPKYRGGSPMNWAIINGKTEFGVTIHQLIESTDAGPIIIQENFCIKDYDYLDLVKRVNKSFFRLTSILLDSFDIHWKNRIPQDQQLASYFHQRKPENSLVNFLGMDAKLIYRMFKALPNPIQRPYFKFKNNFFVISSCKITEGEFRGQPGRVVGNFEGGVVVICKSGSIILNKLVKKNSEREYAAKNFLKPGDLIYD